MYVDTQLYFSVSVNDYSCIKNLIALISDIGVWVTKQSDKTEILVIGEGKREKLFDHLKLFALKTMKQVKDLDVIIDSDLNFKSNIKNVTKVSFYHLRNIARVRPFLSQ